MKKFRVLSIVTALGLTLSVTVGAFAASFGDVSPTKYNWATEAISTMASKGIIKGYEDNTFRPERTVTKLEALVLTARALGVSDSENEPLLDTAIETYGDRIAGYKLSYGDDEIAYLLIKNIISASELSDYLDASNASAGMKRYEVAVLLTKALDAESEVKKNVMTTLEYNDADTIPAYAKKYVEYVTNAGLMNGMDNNNFSPNTDVTRAQAAVLLYKLMGLTDYTFKSGVVADIDTATRVIKIKDDSKTEQYSLLSSVLLRFEGNAITINDIAAGYDAIVTLKGGSVYAIDFMTPLLDAQVYGSLAGTNSRGGETSITINEIGENDASPSTEKTSYTLSDNCVITYNNSAAALNELKSGSYVKLTIKKGKASAIYAYPKESTVSGRISDIEITPVCKLRLELTDGTEETYVMGDNVTVTKNGTKATASEILVGDTAAVTTTYGRVTKVVATSKSQEKTGVITEVIISASPKITLKIDDSNVTYRVTNDCEFKIPGKADACFYDLRAGVAATVKIESDTVVSIATDVAEGITQINGTVLSVNTSYGVIQVSYVDATSGISITEPVFVKNKATIVDISTGNALKLSNIENGAKISAFGSRNNGIFEATAVNVTVTK